MASPSMTLNQPGPVRELRAETLFAEARCRAKTQTLNPSELLAVARQLSDAQADHLALELYQSWTENNCDDPLFYAMTFNQGMLLSSTGNLADAQYALEAAIRAKPDFLPAQINLGFVLERQGALGQAVLQWQQVAQQLDAVTADTLTQKRITLKQLGRVFETVHFDSNAESVLRQSLEISPSQRDVLQHWLSLRQRQCEWPVLSPFGDLTREQMLVSMPPLTLATYTDDPLFQLAVATSYHKNDVGRMSLLPRSVQHPPIDDGAPRPLRIGYLSSDLREHAIGYLIAEVFELHDRSAVEVFAYYSGHPVSDALHVRIKDAVNCWRDISTMDDDQAARTIMEDGISILIDVNGYTHGARTKLLTSRPAPIVVNWLGFPGTMGSPDHHYIIADEFIIPVEDEIFYSETVMRLPCYQPNDRLRRSADRVPSREDVGLPSSGVVYCCFNGAHKLTPFMWKRWMRVLQQVEGSVLWLLEGVATTNDRLRISAAEHGVGADRLVFASRLSHPDHLTRYKLADLFLDTSPYGAHTTASDALWMGVPIITLSGRSFASRVCGSLVQSAGLGELVCYSGAQYTATAVELGRSPSRRAELRQRLQAVRDTCVLFNTPLLVSSLEGLYRDMAVAAKAGQRPRPDLSNLDVYGEIGTSLDRDDRDLLEADYLALYSAALVDKHEICHLRPDARLWKGGSGQTPPRVRSQVSNICAGA